MPTPIVTDRGTVSILSDDVSSLLSTIVSDAEE